MVPDSATSAAVSSAVQEWNAFSGTTEVQFVASPNGTSPASANIQFELTTDSASTDGNCAMYNANTGRIYYGPLFKQAANNGNGATIIAHELGHAMGLADGGTSPSPPSIMNNPSNPPPGGCTNPVVPTSQVQPNDATAAGACRADTLSREAQLNQRSSIGPPYQSITSTTVSPPETCTYDYETVYFYVDGQLDSTELEIVGVSCS